MTDDVQVMLIVIVTLCCHAYKPGINCHWTFVKSRLTVHYF